MKRINFNQVYLEFDKLYQDIVPGQENKLDERCRVIEQFLLSCGWTAEDFFSTMITRSINEKFSEAN